MANLDNRFAFTHELRADSAEAVARTPKCRRFFRALPDHGCGWCMRRRPGWLREARRRGRATLLRRRPSGPVRETGKP